MSLDTLVKDIVDKHNNKISGNDAYKAMKTIYMKSSCKKIAYAASAGIALMIPNISILWPLMLAYTGMIYYFSRNSKKYGQKAVDLCKNDNSLYSDLSKLSKRSK